jgi:primary-amine oxidase
VLVELLQPNKSDALPYLNGEGEIPLRYSSATIQFQATEEPYLQEYIIGPLPVSNQTTLAPLNYPFNKGIGKQRIFNADAQAYQQFLANISASVEDILIEMFNAVSIGGPSAWLC